MQDTCLQTQALTLKHTRMDTFQITAGMTLISKNTGVHLTSDFLPNQKLSLLLSPSIFFTSKKPLLQILV